MRIKNDKSGAFNMEVEKGETLNIQLDGKNAITVAVKEDNKGRVALHLDRDAFLYDGGLGLLVDEGKIKRFAQIEFDLEPEEED